MGLAVCNLQALLLSLKSQIYSQSPPQTNTFNCQLKCMELMCESVWKGVKNLPYSRFNRYISLTEAETQRLALQGLYSRSRGKWGILVLQWAPYCAWKSMERSFCAITILLQSSERILNFTTSQSTPRRHFSDSSAVSQILICGAQMPAATMQRWSLEISTWLVEISNWKSWMSSILLRYSSSQRSDLLFFLASARNCEQDLPADMLQVFTPLISVTLYINNPYYIQYSQSTHTAYTCELLSKINNQGATRQHGIANYWFVSFGRQSVRQGGIKFWLLLHSCRWKEYALKQTSFLHLQHSRQQHTFTCASKSIFFISKLQLSH